MEKSSGRDLLGFVALEELLLPEEAAPVTAALLELAEVVAAAEEVAAAADEVGAAEEAAAEEPEPELEPDELEPELEPEPPLYGAGPGIW